MNDHEALKKEEKDYKEIDIIRKLDNSMVQQNYLQIKQDVQDIIQSEMERMLNDPGAELFGGKERIIGLPYYTLLESN